MFNDRPAALWPDHERRYISTTMTAMRPHIKLDATAAFKVPQGVSYLNTCGMAPRLKCVDQAATQALSDSACPWQSAPDDWFAQTEGLRDRAAAWLGTHADSLAYIPSVSYAMALAAKNCPLQAKQNVLVLAGEYPSNRMIWQLGAQRLAAEMRQVICAPGQTWTEALVEQIDERTAVISVPPVHWADGCLIDLERIGRRAREVRASLIVDASQWLGAMSLNFERIGADFVIVPGHKWLLGAYGLGWLWASPKHCERGEPLEQTILARDELGDFASLGMQLPRYRRGARRFDFGPYPHPLSVPMSLAALKQLSDWGFDRVREELAARNTLLRDAFRRKGLDAGFDARAGAEHFCIWTPPDDASREAVRQALSRASIVVAWRAGRLRLSPHLHLGPEPLANLADVIAAAV